MVKEQTVKEHTPTLVVLVFDPKTGKYSLNGKEWQAFRLHPERARRRDPDDRDPPGDDDDTLACMHQLDPPFACTWHAWDGSQWVDKGAGCGDNCS